MEFVALAARHAFGRGFSQLAGVLLQRIQRFSLLGFRQRGIRYHLMRFIVMGGRLPHFRVTLRLLAHGRLLLLLWRVK
jgi:hypothetical protein